MNSKAAWVEKLPTTLWLYRTTSRSSTRETPFSLTYDIEAILPLEIISIYFQVTEFDANTNEVEQRQDLDILNEKRETAKLRQEAYKARIENYYNWHASKKLQGWGVGAEEERVQSCIASGKIEHCLGMTIYDCGGTT